MIRRLTAVVWVGLLLLGIPVPASASAAAVPDRAPARCEPVDVKDPDELRAAADQADDVYIGSVSEVRRVRADKQHALRAGFLHEVRVLTPLRGDLSVGSVVEVRTEVRTAPEGLGRLAPDPDKAYLFFTEDLSPLLAVATKCGGTQRVSLDAETRDRLVDLLKPNVPEEPTEVQLTKPAGGGDDPPSLTRVAAPGAALALVGVLGLLFVAVGARRT